LRRTTMKKKDATKLFARNVLLTNPLPFESTSDDSSNAVGKPTIYDDLLLTLALRHVVG
jgi:hypothetical protein